jgi:hypothetical protein
VPIRPCDYEAFVTMTSPIQAGIASQIAAAVAKNSVHRDAQQAH